jgi:hypothetical protein
VHILTASGVEQWDLMPKAQVAAMLVDRIADEIA